MKDITLQVKIDKAEDVKEFCQEAYLCPFEVRLHSLDDQYRINAKSILGIFSLDLSKELTLIIKEVSEDDVQKADEFITKIKKYVVH